MMILTSVVNNYMLILQGSSFYVFNPRNLEMSQLSPLYLPEGKSSYKMTAHASYVYVFVKATDVLSSSIVQYDFQDDKWTDFTELPMQVLCVCVSVKTCFM